jgi:hypothetical protein
LVATFFASGPLGIPEDIRVFAPIIVGVERGDAPPTPRKAAVVFNWIR